MFQGRSSRNEAASSLILYLIVVFFSFSNQKSERNKKGQDFCEYCRQPDTIQSPQQWKQKNQYTAENEGSQKCNEGGSYSIIQSSKERGCIDGKSGHQEGKRKQDKGMDCHIEQSGIIAHKSFGHGFSQNLSGKNIRSENMAIIVRFFFRRFFNSS